MKKYLLRSIVLVQLTSLAIVGLLVFITQFINDKVYIYGYEPAEEFLKVILSPFYVLIDNSQYGNSFFLLLHSLCLFLFFSMIVGNIIGVIWYYIKKKTLKPLPWMEDFLLGEVIFIGILVINYLIIYLTNHFSFEIEKDTSLLMFLAVFVGYLPVFLLGRWLWRRGIRLFGGVVLAICGITLAFVSGISIYAYHKQPKEPNFGGDSYSFEEYFANRDYIKVEKTDSYVHYEEEEPIEETSEDVEFDLTYRPENNTKGSYDPLAFKADKEDYMEWDKPDEFYKWNFDKFGRDFLTELFSQVLPILDLEEISHEIDRSKESKYAQGKNLYNFTKELGKDPYMLSSFWKHFGTFTLENMNQSQLIYHSVRARYLLKVYYLDKNNSFLYKDIYLMMEQTEKEVPASGGYNEKWMLKNQLKGLLRVYTQYDLSEELSRDLNNSDINYDEIRWAYSFWARRYREKNIPITLRILFDVNYYVKEKYPEEYDSASLSPSY